MTILFNVLAGAAAVVLASCDSGGSGGGGGPEAVSVLAQSGGCPSIQGTGDPGDLEGIYDVTDYRRDPVNVVYTVIGPDGGATDFDYDGDSFGSGGNCFIKRQEGFASFTLIRDSRYLWTFNNPDENGCAYARDDLLIDRDGDTLNIRNSSGSASMSWRAVEVSAADLLQCN